MVKEENKFGYGIKGKLTSAVAMLLVAVIMVVSSTYAWFTLSTAPEVTGITTAVGANGALEMLLLTKENGEWVYNKGQVGAGDDENTYWGNLVDLSEGYGADKIVLYPSLLNVAGGKLQASPLKTPVYHSDGRVYDTVANTVYGKYNNGSFTEDKDYFGFRGVGVASGMTDRQLAFRNARSQLSTLMASARNKASDSLTYNGSTLANIAMKQALLGAPTFTPAEVTAIGTMITDLKVALGYVEDAYFQAYLAFGASEDTNIPGAADPDAAYNTIKGLVDSCTTIAELDTKVKETLASYSIPASVIPAEITDGITAYNKALTSVTQAETTYNSIDKAATSYTWDQFKDALTPLVNMSSIEINGFKASEASANKDAIIAQALDTGVLVTMRTGGGVYADIADQAKDYKVDISVSLVPLGYNMSIKAKMDTATDVDPVYLQDIYDALSGKEPTSKDATMPLTEFYGYVIDLAFRTNAAQSNLLLQQKGVDRIYSDNNNEDTMGKGSSMTFASADNNFDTAKVKELMGNIRIVFFNTDDGTVFAYAKLDIANATTTADGTTAYMYLYKEVENAFEYTDATGATTVVYKVETVEKDEDGVTDITVVKYYAEETHETEVTVPEGTQLTAISEIRFEEKDAIITDLVQNTAKRVSALVYLDGETIENDDVAASVAQSMTGKMNLQFASDATLVPMEYGELHQTGTQTETKEVTKGTTTFTPDAVSGATWAFKDAKPSDAWSITADNGVVTIPADAAEGTEVVIKATVDEKVVKEITLKIVAAPATGG